MKTGLLRPKFDRHDYLHHSYGSTVPAFPLEFDVDAKLWNPNQNTSNAATGIETVPPLLEGCTDFSQDDIYNNHTRVLHSPMILEDITHANARGGIDIRESLNAARKLGWFDHYGQIQAKSPLDMFDAISNALLSEQADRWAVSAGTQFYREWFGVEGPLPVPFFDPSSPWHNWLITGRTTVQGVPYLRCKMWDGTWKLMSRELCNAVFGVRGAVAFIPSNTAPTGQTIDWTYVQFVVGFFQNLVTALQAKLTSSQPPYTPPPVAPPAEPAQPTSPAPTPVKTVKLYDFCLAIRSHEGWFPGSRSFTNNNPGNCRYSTVGYAPQYLPVLKDDKDFAIFKDYATGWSYLQNLVKERIAAHPDWTVFEFFAGRVDPATGKPKGGYSPSSDGNDPKIYAESVAFQLGITSELSTFTIKNISS